MTPPDGADDIRRRLKRAQMVEVVLFDGGEIPDSRPCSGLSGHGFLGIEPQVVGRITDFITKH